MAPYDVKFTPNVFLKEKEDSLGILLFASLSVLRIRSSHHSVFTLLTSYVSLEHERALHHKPHNAFSLCVHMYVRACVPNEHSRDLMRQCVLMCKLPPLVWEPNLWSLPLHTKCVPIATGWLAQWAQWVDCYNRPSVFHERARKYEVINRQRKTKTSDYSIFTL